MPEPTHTTTPSGSATPTGTDSPSPTASATDTPAEQLTGIPLYYLGDTGGSIRLFREFRTITVVENDPLASAVTALMDPGLEPLDPDYSTPWQKPSRLSVTREGSTVTVDVSPDAFGGSVGSEATEVALQQLVYTLTAVGASQSSPVEEVVLLVNGAAADAWGHVRVGEPMRRAPQADVLSHVWVISPQQGESLASGTVTFQGYGTSFEANFPWAIMDASDEVVGHGSTMGGSMGTFGEFTFQATLEPGTYTVRVETDDPSDGAGPGPHRDDKEFTVQ